MKFSAGYRVANNLSVIAEHLILTILIFNLFVIFIYQLQLTVVKCLYL